MSELNRREFLKRSVVAGVGLAAGGVAFKTLYSHARTFYVVSDRPQSDIKRLIALSGSASGASPRVRTRPATNTRQDLSIIESGQVIDPATSDKISRKFREFALELRSRSTAGTHFITVEPAGKARENMVTFRVNGRIRERLTLDRNYKDIVIPGRQGDTSFRLQDGRLTVNYSSCRHSVCERMGGIRAGRIICAPNKLIATIDAPTEVDGITG